MPRLIRSCVAAGFVLALCLMSGVAMAQAQPAQPDQPGQRGQRGVRGGGGPGGQFDPAQFMERRLETAREQLGATDEAEWNVLKPLLSTVMEKQMAVGVRGFGGRGGFGGGRGPGGPGAGGPGGGRGGMFAPSAEQTALSTALESPNSKTSDIKTALKELRDARKKQDAELEKAREELKKVLSVRQEAQMVLTGVLQ